MKIELNEFEQTAAKSIAKARYRNARSKNIEDKKIGGQSNWQTDLEGIASEIAAAKALNLYPDLEVGHIPIADLTLDGLTIDVKSTTYDTGHLLATRTKLDRQCDLYVLVVGTFPSYELRGWASRSQLFRDKNLKDLGRGRGYALEQSELNSIDRLISYRDAKKIIRDPNL
jgi:hypothetical protein